MKHERPMANDPAIIPAAPLGTPPAAIGFRPVLGPGRSRLWPIAALAVSGVMALPILTIVALSLVPADTVWPHLLATVVPHAARQTLMLMLGVGLLTLLTGAGTAWLVTMYRFPGRALFDWLLILPLAVPTYITAFCYIELFGYTGPVQSALRAAFGFQSFQDYWFPDMRSLGGAIVVMAAVLYPYVYLTARASFIQQSVCVLEVARTLGRTGTGTLFAVALPLARPALAAGVALALMECLNDIGAVQFLGVQTLTATVYATWLQRSSLTGAAQISLVMLTFVLAVMLIERAARRRRQFHHTTGRYRELPGERLAGVRGWLAMGACALPVLFGFVLPVAVLTEASIAYVADGIPRSYWLAAAHSLALSGAAALLAVLLAVLLCFVMRQSDRMAMTLLARVSALGYAVPGTVVALGILIPLGALDNGIDGFMRRHFGLATGLILSGTAFALILAYVIRFLAVALGAVEAGYQRLSRNLDAAARTLGASPAKTLLSIHMPLLRPVLGAAALLVFVDSMKELPATLLLRPFNFETLATEIYLYASLEQFERSALAALTVVVIGLTPLLLLHRTVTTGRPGSRAVAGSS